MFGFQSFCWIWLHKLRLLPKLRNAAHCNNVIALIDAVFHHKNVCFYLMGFRFNLSFFDGQIVFVWNAMKSRHENPLWHILHCILFISPKFTHFSIKFDAKNIEMIQRHIFIRKNRISSYWEWEEKRNNNRESPID